ncbi:hypothetical protein AWH69_12495 [Janibacter melonis]|uniref:Uncharacterized protein n=1 Tax=Janibacter melonis TaxID=262209 RepID=A0A176QBX9_9MICO|nr:hypothetical protein AWH69_12495 [Janibacter melonis]
MLFLAWRDPRHPEAGGSELYVQAIAEQLVRRGHEVVVRVARPRGLRRDENIDGVRYERAGGRMSVYPLGLLRAVREPRTTVIVDVVNGVPFGAGLFPRRRVVAVIHHVHRAQWRMIYPGLGGRLGWFVESRIAPLANRGHPVVTVSEASRNDLIDLGYPHDSVHVVRNGLPQDVIARGASSLTRSRPRPTRLIVLARLVPHKQVEHALLTAAALAPRWPDLSLDVIGDGWWRSKLERQCRELALEDRVTFHGHVTEARKIEILDSSGLMLMPSAKEGWCLAVSEAGLRGIPTIGYRHSGGLAESIKDGESGWLVADLTDLIRTTEEALRAPSEVVVRGRNAHRHARTLDRTGPGARFERILAKENAQRSP